jgi:hypothetical protein
MDCFASVAITAGIVGWAKRSVPTISSGVLAVGTAQAPLPILRSLQRRADYPSSTVSAPFTASAESVTVFSSEPACTAMFSAKNRASAT